MFDRIRLGRLGLRWGVVWELGCALYGYRVRAIDKRVYGRLAGIGWRAFGGDFVGPGWFGTDGKCGGCAVYRWGVLD